MSESFKLKIITPESKIFDDGVLSATFSGAEGEFTVLAKHENGIFLLKVGKIQLVQADGKTKSIISSAGTVQVLDNSVKVLIDKSNYNLDTSVKELKESLAHAQYNLEKAETSMQKDNLENEIKFIEKILEDKEGKKKS